MIIRVCYHISDRETARHAHAGMGFDDIQFELGVAMQRSRGEGNARDVVAQCSATCPSANISLAADIAQGPSWNIQAA